MDISRSFSHMFKDSSWFFKVFIGGMFLTMSIVVVGLPFILGYEIEHIRHVAQRQDSMLPEWKNMRRIFEEGLTVFLAAFVYTAMILALIVAVNGALTMYSVVFATLAVVFFWMPLVFIQYSKRPSFFSCFSLPEILKRCALHPLLYAISLVTGFLTIAATILFGWMSIILGWPFVVFWGILVQSHILGQLAEVNQRSVR